MYIRHIVYTPDTRQREHRNINLKNIRFECGSGAVFDVIAIYIPPILFIKNVTLLYISNRRLATATANKQRIKSGNDGPHKSDKKKKVAAIATGHPINR